MEKNLNKILNHQCHCKWTSPQISTTDCCVFFKGRHVFKNWNCVWRVHLQFTNVHIVDWAIVQDPQQKCFPIWLYNSYCISYGRSYIHYTLLITHMIGHTKYDKTYLQRQITDMMQHISQAIAYLIGYPRWLIPVDYITHQVYQIYLVCQIRLKTW